MKRLSEDLRMEETAADDPARSAPPRDGAGGGFNGFAHSSRPVIVTIEAWGLQNRGPRGTKIEVRSFPEASGAHFGCLERSDAF